MAEDNTPQDVSAEPLAGEDFEVQSEKQVEAFTVSPVYEKLTDELKLELLAGIQKWVDDEKSRINQDG